MSFELPDLDTKTYDHLVAELIRAIPRYTTLWTDYNDTDPGITLVQLLGWLDESLLYQANRIPTLTDENFLRWVLGLAFSTNDTDYSRAARTVYDYDFQALRGTLATIEQGRAATKASLQRDVLLYLQRPYLALTLPNVELLAQQTNLMIEAQYEQQQDAEKNHLSPPPAPLYVQRAYAQARDEAIVAYVLSNAQWQYQYPQYPNNEYDNSADTMRRVLLLQPVDNGALERTLLKQVGVYLQPRVLAGNAVRVEAAELTEIDLKMTIRCTRSTAVAATLDALFALLYGYLLPTGGPGGTGWAYGHAPSADELKHLVLGVPGVDALDAFDYAFYPTIVLAKMAELGANTLLAALPGGNTAMLYGGLPQLRCLDVTATTQPA
ncbi:hypothetical protein GWC77_16245 [Paraburkholderia sp. NMBU_R16]|uniref:hypothetical protein n=1 Tax=Paraburkholderia sp. NMBU_R16 TaxID=2698676 RepID=UPI001566B29A|nr:hypothetical protein [Paraburkholderia sp. NMBU_R16]NRO97475.1 hypothetical protein [Paraburkholderia sp. NMBU_R16]